MATQSLRKPRKNKPRPIDPRQRLLYPVPDAAFQIAISTSEVWKGLKAGWIRPTKIGKRKLIAHAELLRVIQEHTVQIAEARAADAEVARLVGPEREAPEPATPDTRLSTVGLDGGIRSLLQEARL